MNECQRIQNLLLEHLYGLLDAAEDRALLGHVGSCAPCQTALAAARHEQQLLAAAARQEFAAVHFDPPVEAAHEEPETLPIPAPSVVRRPLWRRWALAAALLLALAGLGTPAAYYGVEYAQTRDVVRHHADEVRQKEQAVAQLGDKLREIPEDKRQKIEGVFQEARKRQLNMVVSGPQRVQVGAPSEYRIQTRNLDGRPVPSRLDITVVDRAKNKVLLAEKDVQTQGEHQLTLQPNLEVRPDALLALEVTARRDGDRDADSTLTENLELAAPVYVTHLATDRPLYQPGETVRFRSLTLERFSLKPPAEDFHLVYSITKPTGEKVDLLTGSSHLLSADGKMAELRGPDGQPLRGLGCGEYTLDPITGGEFTLSVREANNRFPPQERKFIVNAYQPSALNKELNFDRSSYGAGDPVTARLHVTRPGGEPAASCQATPAIWIDGKPYGTNGQAGGPSTAFKADEQGNVNVVFKLPSQIERGQASLSVALQDGKVPDSITRTIPIILKKLVIEFFPEGGDLIAGADNRVYFQVRTTLDKPGDVRGQIVDDHGTTVVDDIHTLTDANTPGVNQGMGVFSLRPEFARKYELKITSPLGISSRHPLPEAKRDGVVLNVVDGVSGPDHPIRVKVCSPQGDKALLVGAYCRGRLLDHQMVTVKQGECTEVALLAKEKGDERTAPGGVYRITAFEDLSAPDTKRRQFVPRAERLVYRQPAQQLKLDIRPDRSQYIPGDRVTLTVTARNEKDQATGAVVLLSVVDQRTLTMADEKTARTMPTHFLLTTEVRKPEDLEHADFLLSADERAHQALDLLLGTQGWRRFAEQDPTKFRQQFHGDAERLLVTIGQSSQRVIDFAQQDAEKVARDFDERYEKLEGEHTEAAAGLVAVRGDAGATAAGERLQQYNDWLDRYGRLASPLAGLVLVVLVLAGLLVLLPRTVTRSAPFALGTAMGVLALLFVSLLPLLWLQQNGSTTGATLLARNNEPAIAPMRRGVERAEAMAEGMKLEKADAAPPPPKAPAPMAAAAQGRAMAPPADDALQADRKLMEGFDKAKKLQARAKFGLAKGEARRFADGVAEKQNREQEQLGARHLEEMKRLRDMPAGALPPGGFRAGPMGPAGFGGGRGAWAQRPVPPPPPFVVREYAHKNAATDKSGLRTDFAETLLWQPALVIPADGKATVSFDLCDSVTTFAVAAAGNTLDGRLGTASAAVESRLPFTLDPKTPIEVSSADLIDLPVTIRNNTTQGRTVKLTGVATGLDLLGDPAERSLTIDGQSAARRIYRFRPNTVEGQARVEFRGKTEPFAADSIARAFRIVPDGFPVVASHSDLLEKTASTDLVLPDTWVKGTLKCRVQVYPSTLASLQKGLEGLLREPGGCFEQTSTCNYPNVLILDYLKESDQARPDVEARARDLLNRGYQRLTSFECPKTAANSKQGYEWFGAPDGAHEALTAYGLLEFRDMARVYKVDGAMLERTRQYLLASRDGQGGFKRNPRALDTFGRAPADITNAYIVWALTESGKDDDVNKELDALAGQAKTSKDPYFLSLVANSLLNRDRAGAAVALLKTVASLQKEDGHLDAQQTSITGSGGRDLQIETTALAVLGWLKANRPGDFILPTEKAVKWIGQQRGGYGAFGSTQSTILALKALIAHARANKKTPEAGELTFFVGDVRVGRQEFAAGAQDALTIEMPNPEKHLKPGKNSVRVQMTGKNAFPYTLTWSYQTLTPVSAEGCAVRLATKLDRAAADEGQVVHLKVTLENLKDQGQGMAVAIIGLPAGLSLPEDLKQLKEHAQLGENGTKPGLISMFETRSRELILYWRDLAPKQKIEVPIDLVCRVPGEYRGPASRAYLYYNADAKHWVEPLSVKVAVKE